MSSAYALPLDQQLKARDSSRNSNSTKSLVLSILMISMSLSTGIIEVNQPTSNLEESPAEFDLSPISESISSVLASITELIWPTEDSSELESSEAINTGARSTPPSITLSAGSVTLVYDIPMQAITPSNSGGAATSWSIDPTLPGGLSFDTSTGEISGTPTALSPATDYTVTATNSFGSDFAVIEISVVQQFPVVQYNPTSFTFNVGTAITDGNGNPGITPNVIQGTGLTWTVTPSLPGGINLDSSTGVISGTPTVASSQATYQVRATNSEGSNPVNLQIQVNDVPPSGITYPQSSYILTKGVELTPAATPTSSGGTVTSWAITPSLPSGLQFDTVTGVISGTPTVISNSATYTVTATNSGGSSTTTLTFQVNDVAPSSIQYNPNSFTETVDAAMSNLVTPTYSGGAITSWTVTPSLPIGLSLNSNGVISGTPTVVTPQTVYTITGSNTGGSDSTTVTIQVNDKAPVFYYSVTQIQMTKGQPQSLTPTVSSFGGAVVSYSVSPTLPNGLGIDTVTGEISGTPTDITPSQTYTITATNSGGSSLRELIIEVNDAQPVIGYSPTSYT
ncbi:MAG: putative Ig domain-containing protein, partial [Candidatus Thermoplasmatota archaeon]|nr:putative Ig domain-containing protein [Candidatus Thermoplasmatota archaeon]